MERVKAAEASVAWEYRILRSRNRARKIYSVFSHKWRYYRAINIVQKLALVIVATFLSKPPYCLVAAILMLVIYAAWMVVAVWQRPYFDPASNAINVAASLGCLVSTILILLARYDALGGLGEETIVWILVSFNYLLPLVCLPVGLVLAYRHRSKHLAIAEELEGALPPSQLVELTSTRKKVDQSLNRSTLSLFASAFMLSAFCAFVAVFLVIVGAVHASATGLVVRSTPEGLGAKLFDDYRADGLGEELAEDITKARIREYEFLTEHVNATDWESFIGECCCRDQYPDDEELANRTELWTCRKKPGDAAEECDPTRDDCVIHKQRQRVGESKSGLTLRRFCDREFAAGGADPVWVSTEKAFAPKFENVSDGSLPAHWELW